MATILVVDDRPLNREFLATLLGYVGHSVIEAGNGIDALVTIGEQRPDLVITDLVMPGMDGVEFTRRLRSDPDTASLPVIFYTANYRAPEAQALAARCGVETIIYKPAEPQFILDTVAAALGAQSPASLPRSGPEDEAQPGILATQPPAHLGTLQLRLNQSVTRGLELVAPGSEDSTQALAGIFGAVQSLSLRMSAVIELGLELPVFRDRKQLVEVFCRAAQDILNARLAVVGVLDASGGIPDITVAGYSANGWKEDLDPSRGLIARALASGQPCSAYGLMGNPAGAGFPDSHPAIESVVVAPLVTAGRAFGWFYAADKVGGGAFSADDEQFAATLAAQLAVAYDNLSLYQAVAEHAARLEAEIAARQALEEALRISQERRRQPPSSD